MKVKILLAALAISFFGTSVFLIGSNLELRQELLNRNQTIYNLLTGDSNSNNKFKRQYYDPNYNSSPINVTSDKPLSDSAIQALLEGAQKAAKEK